jgi:hypothetical protein
MADDHEQLLGELRRQLAESRQQEERLKDVLTRLLDIRDAAASR